MDRFDDPKSYRQKRESFTRSLQHFHETRGTPFKKIPQFCGKEVDLFRLYNVVTQRGGWVKVNRTNQWKDILHEFNIPKGCVNGGNALKQIYLRYLDRYEKVHYLGESGDRHDLDEEDIETRHRRWSTRSIHTVPLTYNHHQHVVVDNLRKFNGLSSDIYKPSDYDRLALSLVSPLPNEQDFAINVCTLLSNEGKHTLKLEKCPRIVDFLLAHAGVYNHSNLRVLFEEVYGQIRGHSLATFWSDVLETTDLLDLTDESNFVKKFPKRFKIYRSSGGRTFDGTDSYFGEDQDGNSTHTRNISPRKNDSRTVGEVSDVAVTVSETKDNDTANNRLTDSSENPNNSIQDSLKVGTGNNFNRDSCSVTNDDVCRNDEETSVKINTSVNSVKSNAIGSSDNVSGGENSGDSKWQGFVKPGDVRTTSNSVSSATKVQETAAPGEKVDGSESSSALTNLNVNESANLTEVKCEEDSTSSSVKIEAPDGSGVVEGEEGQAVAKIKTPEEIALEEEERRKEEERLREEKERLEAEEKARKEAEEKKRVEEERLRAIQEAKKLEKQLREAEVYEAMLREEENKKKRFFWEETPTRKTKSSEKGVLKVEPEDLELFCLGRENGTRDYIGQRVLQVAHILRNLTFCEESMHVMAKNTTFLRFLILCVNSKWSSLHQLGLDMLGNISPEITIEDPAVDRIFQAFFWTIHRGIQHTNRFFIISCLEILNKICQKDENEDVVCRNLDQSVYDQVCRLLSLHDIMILLYTLECLYSMSSMGEKACTYICRSKGAIEMLLALITVEAQSYGPKACILMRVIETVSGSAAANPPPPTSIPPPQTVTPSPTPVVPTLTACVAQPGTPQPAPPLAAVSTMTVQQATIPKIIAPTIMRTPSPKAMVGMPMAAVATPVQISATQCPPPLVQTMPTLPTISTIATMPTVQQQHAHQQTVQENEQFALAWLRATFELSVGGKVESQDLYKRYVESCNKMGRKGVIASIHFPRFVRSVFGGTVGPKSQPIPAADVKPGGPTTQSFYEGIKARDVPLTINIKLVPVTEVPRPGIKKRPQVSTPKSKAKRKKPETPTSPILKAQLISPSKPSSPSPSPSPSHTDGKVQVSTQTHPGPVSVGQSSSPPCTPPPMDNSTLIKSLLASKVSEICMTAPPGMLSDNTQVTQRQQQQKILQQQQLQGKVLETSVKAKVIRLNGIIQDSSGSSSEYQLATAVAKGKKEPPQPPTTATTTTTTTTGGNTSTVANLLRPKTPKIDGEDSDSMASTSRDCAAAGGGNVSSADDNDNSLTSFEGIFNGIPDSLDFDATVSTIVKENCAKKAECVSVITSDKNMKQKGSNEENLTSIQVANKSVGEDACVKQVDDKSMTEDSCVKQPQSKSLMLADLLDKKEGPALNGVLGKDLRIGEKGLELVEKAILKETHLNHKGITVKKDSVVSVNGDTRTGAERSTVIINATTMMGGASGAPQCGSKRSTEPDQEVIEEKRPKLDAEAGEDKGGKKGLAEKKVGGLKTKDSKEEVNGEEEVRASSTAANLFAALAAEALEDETDYEVPSEPQPQTVVVPGGQIRPLYLGESPPLIVTASGTRQIIMAPGQLSQQGQVLFSAGGQSLPVIVQNQRIVQGGSGQMLVASQPQQIIMSGNTQSQMLIAQPQTALVQGQPQTVLVAQTAQQQPGTKTIIILQPQSQGNANTQPQKVVMTAQGAQMVVATPVARQVVQAQSAPPLAATVPTSIVGTSSTTREDVVLTSGIQTNPSVPSLHQNGSQIQIISSGIQNNAPILNQNGADKNKTVQNGSAKTPATGSKTNENTVFICEWRGCMRSFRTANEVYMHVCNAHCPTNVDVETQCLWERCDGMKRKRFSLMTHLFDRHCNADALNMMAARRKQLSTQGRSEIPAPTPPPPHPGYAPNAAFHAIKRHALEFVNPKELLKANGAKACPPQQTIAPPGALLLAKVASPPVQVKDDNEGPVTKSIRLTASLILRNLVIYSSVGRRFLKGYEPHLASIALSNVESSRTIAQVLADLNDSSSR